MKITKLFLYKCSVYFYVWTSLKVLFSPSVFQNFGRFWEKKEKKSEGAGFKKIVFLILKRVFVKVWLKNDASSDF